MDVIAGITLALELTNLCVDLAKTLERVAKAVKEAHKDLFVTLTQIERNQSFSIYRVQLSGRLKHPATKIRQYWHYTHFRAIMQRISKNSHHTVSRLPSRRRPSGFTYQDLPIKDG